MLNIQTFDARAGGNVLYKALAHPLAAERLNTLFARLREAGTFAVYDPEGIAESMWALYPEAPQPASLYVHDTEAAGKQRAGLTARALVDLPQSKAPVLLIAAFDARATEARIRHLLPKGAELLTLDEARVPDAMLTNRRRYLDRLNFATNFAFFREDGRFSTRLVTANYWAGYGAGPVKLWLRLFGEDGGVLATWEQDVPRAGFILDSAEIRARFALPPFTGQLCLHAIGVAGHDVIKYALDTYASDNGASLSCTHDANAWPSERYAGLPAPRADERVILWVQNSHATPIPPGAIALDRMGAAKPVAYNEAIGPFATVALDTASLLPDVRWPAQLEVLAGRHMVRPRYEVVQQGRTRIAHVNVERADLMPDPAIRTLHEALGRGYLLPFPILPRDRYSSVVLPTPMAHSQANLPLRLDIFTPDGTRAASRYLGCLERGHALALEIDEVGDGHGELVYDFREGGEADGWLHALVRYQDRNSGHTAESSFGAHIFNTAMTFRDEPQSYSGPPPGLTTRLFLKLGDARRNSFACLIYPASAAWLPRSDTRLQLHNESGEIVAEQRLAIACSGSAMVWPHLVFGAGPLREAGAAGYVLIRDVTCRLFGYHGLMDAAGGFSLDHMFGF